MNGLNAVTGMAQSGTGAAAVPPRPVLSGSSRTRAAVVDRGRLSYGSDRGAEREAW